MCGFGHVLCICVWGGGGGAGGAQEARWCKASAAQQGCGLSGAKAAPHTTRSHPCPPPCPAQVLTKSLLPLPDKWHGLADVEQRYRKR